MLQSTWGKLRDVSGVRKSPIVMRILYYQEEHHDAIDAGRFGTAPSDSLRGKSMVDGRECAREPLPALPKARLLRSQKEADRQRDRSHHRARVGGGSGLAKCRGVARVSVPASSSHLNVYVDNLIKSVG